MVGDIFGSVRVFEGLNVVVDNENVKIIVYGWGYCGKVKKCDEYIEGVVYKYWV